ncbi:YdcF family protein [soil metagenome]
MENRDIELAEILWTYHCIASELVESDVIIGLGSYDTRVAEHCVKLLADGWAPVVIFTGAQGNFTRGKWAKSEAETFAEVAIGAGADPAKILIEPAATNTGENIHFTKALCAENGIEASSAIVVSKPSMNRRAHATCLLHWPELKVTCSAPDTHFLRNPAPGHTPEDVVSEMVGDLQRIIEYPKAGYQAHQHVPEAVQQAYEELLARGYTNHRC